MATASERRYKLSSFKFMGLLREPDPNEPQPPSTYWKPTERDYSKLAAKLKEHRMDR